MRIFLTVCLLCSLTVVSAKGILDYPLSDTERELYKTGSSNESVASISWGEHLNSAISPNYFESVGAYFSDLNKREFNSGDLIFNSNIDLSILTPSVPFSADDSLSNFKLRGDINCLYNFNIRVGLKDLEVHVGPYTKIDTLVGYYDGIENILFQSLFALNIGVSAKAEYSLLKTVHFGLGYSTFLIGIDTGRDGYNKDYLPYLTLSTFGNFLDMELTLYGELDLSRTESLKLQYNHSVFSVFDNNNKIISGENRIGLSYVKKLVR